MYMNLSLMLLVCGEMYTFLRFSKSLRVYPSNEIYSAEIYVFPKMSICSKESEGRCDTRTCVHMIQFINSSYQKEDEEKGR